MDDDARPDGRQCGLLVEKLGPTELLAGERFEYRIRVTNLTDRTLSSVVVVESLLHSLRLETATPPSQLTEEHSGRWSLGPISPRGESSIRVTCCASKAMRFQSYTSVSSSLEP